MQIEKIENKKDMIGRYKMIFYKNGKIGIWRYFKELALAVHIFVK